MSDEIKEILDKLKDGNWYEELDLTGTMWIELTWEETHLLLDYITNLQEERNMYKASFETMSQNYFERQQENQHLDKVNCHLRKKINNDIYKSRVEKIAEKIEPFIEWGECTINGKLLKEIYNILQGGKDE